MSAIFAAASRLAMHDEKGNAFDGLYAPTAIVVLMLSIWEVLVRALHVNSVILPPPSEIMETLIERRGLLIDHLSSSLILIGSGLILSVVGGVSVAIAFTFSRRLREGVYPLLIISQVVPKVAIAPLFIVWFGTGTLPCLLLGFLIAFFPMTINSVLGFQSVDEESYRMARAFMGSKWQIFWKVQFPNALPYMFSGMKISLTLVIIVLRIVFRSSAPNSVNITPTTELFWYQPVTSVSRVDRESAERILSRALLLLSERRPFPISRSINRKGFRERSVLFRSSEIIL